MSVMIKAPHIGPFALQGLLGDGARSRVWRARDLRNGSERALKLVPLHDTAGCARLRNELALAGPIDHPRVLRIVGVGEDVGQGVAWLATQCLTGQRAPRSLAVFRQLLEALAELHAHAIVHCDVKPANLLASRDGNLKLADFGLARRAGQQHGQAHGSPHYMSPEQLRGQALDPRSDLFSAAVVLFELVAGRLPFPGSPFEALQRILRADILFDHVAPLFVPLLRRALALDPRARFGDASHFLATYDAVWQAR